MDEVITTQNNAVFGEENNVVQTTSCFITKSSWQDCDNASADIVPLESTFSVSSIRDSSSSGGGRCLPNRIIDRKDFLLESKQHLAINRQLPVGIARIHEIVQFLKCLLTGMI